jgi:hypothetical protein
MLLEEMAEKKAMVFNIRKDVTIRLPPKSKLSTGTAVQEKKPVHPRLYGGTPYTGVSPWALPGSFEGGKRR